MYIFKTYGKNENKCLTFGVFPGNARRGGFRCRKLGIKITAATQVVNQNCPTFCKEMPIFGAVLTGGCDFISFQEPWFLMHQDSR